tara:strand:+ start:1786 stop:2415 length:630 start_codon:yes stop_codon:yes gene_type:complete
MVVIMHVGGAPGSGKTYLGKQLKSKYPNLKVIDTDMLKDKFIEKPIPENIEIMEKLANFDPNKKKTKAQIALEKKYEKNYTNYIQNKFNKLHKQQQKYLLVGHFFMFDDYHIDIPANHKLFLNVDKDTLFSRRNGRLIKDISNNNKYFIDLVNNGEEFWNYNYLWTFTNLKDIQKQLTNTKKYYQKYKYSPATSVEIENIISKELKKNK